MGDSEGPLKMKEPQKTVKLEIIAKDLDPVVVKQRLTKAFDEAIENLANRLDTEAKDYARRAKDIKDPAKLFKFANNRPSYLSVNQDNAGNITGFSVDQSFLNQIRYIKKELTKVVTENVIISGFESGSTKNSFSFAISNELAARIFGDALKASICIEKPAKLAKNELIKFEDVSIPEGHYPISLDITKSTPKVQEGKHEPTWLIELKWPNWIEKGEFKFEDEDKTEGRARILGAVPKKLA
ncbi:hypothetical protein HZC08_01310 [Candidatus Micrarchaeota archaeon]|nr:hypothetical protein [Candidatus Micrarchaeota archaeon]